MTPSTTCTVGPTRADHLSPADPLTALAERLGHSFADAELLERAICHRSWCAENAGHEPNERLEFLGDAVLGLIVAEHVFSTYPTHDEGWLSRARSSVVRASALSEMATDLDLGSALRLGKGEAASGGREKTSILADAMEAVIGAVYLDGGWPAARALVLRMVEARVAELPGGRGDRDHKSMLQEVATREVLGKPTYQVSEHGPEHHKTFDVAVILGGRPWGEGSGHSKKQAEQVAARVALERLSAGLHPNGATPPAPPSTAAPLPLPEPGEPQDA